MALNIGTIVVAALRLQNDEGLDSVTTRRLALALGVQGPALYRHVRSKQELLGHMTAAVLAEGLIGLVPVADWREWLRSYGRSYRAVLLRYRDSARMLSLSQPSQRTRDELVPAIYRPLMDGGMARRDALFAVGLVASYVLGWVAHEQNPALRTTLEQDFALDQTFDDGIDCIVRGLDLHFLAANEPANVAEKARGAQERLSAVAR